MIRPVTVPRPVPALLSFVAGYVDSIIFLGLFGIFVAQMTGSFVLAGTQFVAQEHGLTIKLLGIPIFFLSGCVATALAAATGDRSERALTWAFYIRDNPEVCVPSPVFCGLTVRKRR